MSVRERIREQPLPGEAEAAARSWSVVEAALAEQTPARRARRPRRYALRLALVAAALCVGLVAALTPAGAEVGDWIGDRFADRPKSAAPAFAGLPRGESVLAISHSGAFAVHPDGSWRRLGSFADAGWSPRGLNVVATGGHRVVAMDPAGTHKWSVVRPGRVSHPAWSTGLGFFVAYLEGDVLRSVGGNGAGDRVLRRGAAPVTPAWRRHVDHVLVYARERGGLEAVDVARGATLWHARGQTALRTLASSRGRAMAGGWWRARLAGSLCSTPAVACFGLSRSRVAPGSSRSIPRARGPPWSWRVRAARASSTSRSAVRARRGSYSRATWTASHGRAMAAACCSRGATPTSGSCSARTAACAGRCTA